MALILDNDKADTLGWSELELESLTSGVVEGSGILTSSVDVISISFDKLFSLSGIAFSIGVPTVLF